MCNVPPLVRVLKKTPRTPKIENTDTLELDPDFKNPKRVRGPAGVPPVRGCTELHVFLSAVPPSPTPPFPLPNPIPDVLFFSNWCLASLPLCCAV